jgi:hypothetical protein
LALTRRCLVCEGDGLDVDEGDGLLGVGADEGNVGAVLGGDVLLGDVVFGHEGLAGGDLEVGAVEGARKEFADAAGDGLLEAVVDAAAVRASEDVYADRADGCALGARRCVDGALVAEDVLVDGFWEGREAEVELDGGLSKSRSVMW